MDLFPYCTKLWGQRTYKTVKWVEDTLIEHPGFALPNRKELLKSEMEYEVLVIDSAETAIERPKKSNKDFIQVRNTLKTQLIIGKQSEKIICTSFANGRKQDFRIFKELKITRR